MHAPVAGSKLACRPAVGLTAGRDPGRYLRALEGLRDSPFLARCKRTTRLRLQAELYSLTQVSQTITRSEPCRCGQGPLCSGTLRCCRTYELALLLYGPEELLLL